MSFQTNRLFALVLIFVFSCNKTPGNAAADTKISIFPLTVNEGNGGTNTLQYKFSLNAASSKQVQASYSTEDISARNIEDFVSVTNQTVIFQPGETEKTVPISLVADDAKEGDEVFRIVLSSPVNASIQVTSAEVTIVNDDARVPFSNNGYQAPTAYAGYTLSWNDEFNGSSLDAGAWAHETGDGCPNLCGWGNNELEYYTSRPENLFFQDGKMIIEARSETLSGKNYTSSKILTRNKKFFKYGRVDIRAILPKGKGIWPAFWMLPENNVHGGWPKSGEIDIMEMVGHEPKKVYGTLHYGPGPGSTQISRS